MLVWLPKNSFEAKSNKVNRTEQRIRSTLFFQRAGIAIFDADNTSNCTKTTSDDFPCFENDEEWSITVHESLKAIHFSISVRCFDRSMLVNGGITGVAFTCSECGEQARPLTGCSKVHWQGGRLGSLPALRRMRCRKKKKSESVKIPVVQNI